MQIKVTSNVGPLTKALDAFGKKQIPFATSMALNDAAFAVRRKSSSAHIPPAYGQEPALCGAMFRVGKATKRNLVSTVSDVLGRDYMVNQAEGGTKAAAWQAH